MKSTFTFLYLSLDVVPRHAQTRGDSPLIYAKMISAEQGGFISCVKKTETTPAGSSQTTYNCIISVPEVAI